MIEPDREETVFATLLELPPDQRAAHLARIGAEDPSLRQRLEELLQVHESGDAFMTTPAAAALAESAARSEKAGDRIGRYKLLEQIGEGGCGVVYVAEQTEPVRRRVALKVIKLGMDTRQVVARFEAERQALALMDHPHIARVLDAGATETGRPYFVMELVRGVKITDYCDQNNLSTIERLKLFNQVCRAVQHAHQKGVIHRDLKPSNILVTVNDGIAVPKVIDFGIAKAAQGRLTDKTIYTAFEQFIGTPAYMSPEQAVMTSLDVDTRSDIYSLGVLLYELLTGKTPFEIDELLESGLDAMRQTIREKAPPKPSTRLSTLLAADLVTVAHHRQVEPPKLIHAVRGDLDWIVMKCLEKDRSRRYETANGLAADIERHLKCEPVVARPPSGWYEFQKTVRRHKVGFAATAAVVFALVAGFGISAWMYLREKNAFREQSRLRIEAENARASESRLRVQLQARLGVTRARELVAKKEYAQAEEVLDGLETEFLTGDVDANAIRRTTLWEYVKKRQWNEVADRFPALIREDGTAWNDLVANDYGAYLGTLVQTGRIEEHNKFRRLMLKRFETNDEPALSDFLCSIAMLTPADQEIGSAMATRYDIASRILQSDDREQWPEAGHRYSLALTDYRLGNFRRAVPLCASALCIPQVADNFNGMGLALYALTRHKLNEGNDARIALTLCHSFLDPAFTKGPDSVGWKNFSGWWVWLTALALQREADALLGAPGERDFQELEQRRTVLREAEGFATNQTFYGADRTEHDRAEKVAIETPAVLQRMERVKFAALLNALGIWEIQHHEWRRAMTNWSLVVYGPSDYGSLLFRQNLSDFYMSYAPLLVELNEREQYERFRQSAIATFGQTKLPVSAARTIEACLLRPADERQMAALARLVDLIEAKGIASNSPPNSDLVLALFKYRSGNPTGALESVRKKSSAGSRSPAVAAKASVLSAMCLARIGSLNDARAELDSVRDSINNKFNSPLISDRADLATWRDWWVDHILLQEAQILLQERSADASK